jgi:inosine-uridine nucleoside N-ribohydrolase
VPSASTPTTAAATYRSATSKENPSPGQRGRGRRCFRDSRYARQIAEAFPGKLARGDDAPDATDLYRRILAEQPDESVVIVTIGYKTILRNLLASGVDRHSDLNGVDLVRRKVAKWVCMGGNFARSQTEANLVWDAPASSYAIEHWPTPIVFSGVEQTIQPF